MPGLNSLWMRHLPDDRKEGFEKALRHDTLVLGRLMAIIKEAEDQIDYTEVRSDQFDNPNWALKTAYQNGRRSGLKYIKDLLNFLDHKE